MIDFLVVKAPIGTTKPHHLERLALVTFTRFSMSNSKPTTTYVDSPLTGAQIDVKYCVEHVAGLPMAHIEIAIPLASATIGQNYAHAGLDTILFEVECAACLVRLTLAVLGLKSGEIQLFMEHAETQLLELTWHTRTASKKALRNLQKRTAAFFERSKEASGRHDVAIRDVDYRRKNGDPGLLVMLKSGDEFRQYGKYDQIAAKSNLGKKRYAVSAEMREKIKEAKLVKGIETHARNEIRLGLATLTSLGLANPKSWRPEALKRAIESVWRDMDHTNSKGNAPSTGMNLSPQARDTFNRYLAGEQIKDALPPYTFTRHRQSILRAYKQDIAIPPRCAGPRQQSVLSQLNYDRRWKPSGELTQLVLCDETGPAIVAELKRGIAFIESGEIPDFPDDDSRGFWLRRWKHFAERQRVWNLPSVADTCLSELPTETIQEIEPLDSKSDD